MEPAKNYLEFFWTFFQIFNDSCSSCKLFACTGASIFSVVTFHMLTRYHMSSVVCPSDSCCCALGWNCRLYSLDHDARSGDVYDFVKTCYSAHLKRVFAIVGGGARQYPLSDFHLLSRIQNCLTSYVRLCCFNVGSALLRRSVNRYLGDGKHTDFLGGISI